MEVISVLLFVAITSAMIYFAAKTAEPRVQASKRPENPPEAPEPTPEAPSNLEVLISPGDSLEFRNNMELTAFGPSGKSYGS